MDEQRCRYCQLTRRICKELLCKVRMFVTDSSVPKKTHTSNKTPDGSFSAHCPALGPYGLKKGKHGFIFSIRALLRLTCLADTDNHNVFQCLDGEKATRFSPEAKLNLETTRFLLTRLSTTHLSQKYPYSATPLSRGRRIVNKFGVTA